MKNIAFLWIMLFAACTIASAQPKSRQIDDLVSTFASYNQFNGSILVADNGTVIYKKGFGLANQSANIPNSPETRHRLASVTKQFTAMLIMQLVAEDKLQLDVPISKYLPRYPKAVADKVTIHHLLTHTSGIPNYTSFPDYTLVMKEHLDPAEIVDLFKDTPLDFTPGEKFAYSNSGYVLLGHIIEKVSGKTYEQMMQAKIFDPLSMANSGYEHADDNHPNKAVGYNQAGSTFSEAQFIDMSIPFAAGALYSTVEDLYLWDQALYTKKLLPKKYLDMMAAPHVPAGNQHYGYGLEIGTLPVGNSGTDVGVVGHSGGINGFVTHIIRIPSEKSTIILLSNSSNSAIHDMLVAINGILHNESFDPPKRSASYAMYDILQQKGSDAALSMLDNIQHSNEYYTSEFEMNMIGYDLLSAGKAKEAAAVFKWNVKTYPHSFNVYDSYAEALLVTGDTAQSIANYKKSVEMNPGNTNGMKVLRSLGVNPEDFLVKVPVDHLNKLAGDYVASNVGKGREWRISFTVVDGVLMGNDRGYKYRLAPQGNDEFINPDDGAVLKFDTTNPNVVMLSLFGNTFVKE